LIVQHAVRMRIPRSAVARMLLNIYLDTLVGMIPLVGDAFDFAFKANTKNIAILRESLLGERAAGRDWLFVGGMMLALAISLALPIRRLGILPQTALGGMMISDDGRQNVLDCPGDLMLVENFR
jgi:hypothetical protein